MARRNIATLRLILICLRFRKLGTPMSSHTWCLCALSISWRVGAARSCIQRLDAASSIVLRTLMIIWRPELRWWDCEQSPRCIVPRSPIHFHLILKYTIAAILVRSTDNATTEQAIKTVRLLDRQVRQVWAFGWAGFASGNHGPKNSSVANLGLSSIVGTCEVSSMSSHISGVLWSWVRSSAWDGAARRLKIEKDLWNQALIGLAASTQWWDEKYNQYRKSCASYWTDCAQALKPSRWVEVW